MVEGPPVHPARRSHRERPCSSSASRAPPRRRRPRRRNTTRTLHPDSPGTKDLVPLRTGNTSPTSRSASPVAQREAPEARPPTSEIDPCPDLIPVAARPRAEVCRASREEKTLRRQTWGVIHGFVKSSKQRNQADSRFRPPADSRDCRKLAGSRAEKVAISPTVPFESDDFSVSMS